MNPGLDHLLPGHHVCWTVQDSDEYVAESAHMLRQGEAYRQKPMVFGPAGTTRDELQPLAAVCADPWTDVLGSAAFDPQRMYRMFRDQTAVAISEGYTGLRLMADMDWLLPAGSSSDAIVAFEVVLDAVVKELDATVVCAYRAESFDRDAVTAVHSVHPHGAPAEECPFRFVAGETGVWQLSGEVDFGSAPTLAAAVSAVAQTSCTVDITALQFVDVAGMRAIASAPTTPQVHVRLVGASPMVRRCWSLARFDEFSPTIELVG